MILALMSADLRGAFFLVALVFFLLAALVFFTRRAAAASLPIGLALVAVGLALWIIPAMYDSFAA
jgi:uncharacterized membrane protein YoaT (DUF817 family)